MRKLRVHHTTCFDRLGFGIDEYDFCPSSRLIIAARQRDGGGPSTTPWLVWALDGRLVQVFTTDSDAVFAPERSPGEGPTLVVPRYGECLEAWDVVTGELRWRDPHILPYSNSSLELGTTPDGLAVRSYDESRKRFCIDPVTGAAVPAHTFTPIDRDAAIPASFSPQAPAPEHRPFAMYVDPTRYELDHGRGNKDANLDQPLAAWLADTAPPRPLSRGVAPRTLAPSPAVRRQLERFVTTEKLGAVGRLSVADAKRIYDRFGDVSDDVLAMYALHSRSLRAAWRLDATAFADLDARLPHSIKYARRLRPFGITTEDAVVAFHASWDAGVRVSLLTGGFCRGSEPLAKWLSDVRLDRYRFDLGSTGPITFEISDAPVAAAPIADDAYVVHKTYGRGRVIEKRGDVWMVEFESGRKKMKRTSLV